jgi:hypothetical protein
MSSRLRLRWMTRAPKRQQAEPEPHEDARRELRLETMDTHDVGTMLHLFDRQRHVGKLGFSVCEICRMGHVLKLSVYEDFDGRGVGEVLLRVLRNTYPELTWHTSAQIPSSVGFWKLMAVRSGHPYTERPRCDHPHRRVTYWQSPEDWQ